MIEIELTMTEKLIVAPIFPLQVLSAWGEECLTVIVGWLKMGPPVSF